MKNTKITPLYERLSRDDELQGDSNSIIHQKQMLEDYAVKNGFPNPLHFTDDGISGTRFDRPSFTAMMEEVEAGRVEAIIVKDMSRLGRDYLKVGQIMEILRQKGIRLIAINDGVDSDKGDDDFIPFRNIMNEWHARDTSKKIKAAIMASAKRGKRIGTKAPYGYKKHPDAPKQIIPNADTAPIVQRIFSLCSSGLGPDKIARMLMDEQILTPTAYEFRTNGVRHTNLNEHKPFAWCGTTVATILDREEYIGTTVNYRSFHPSFKKKKSKQNPPEKWLRFENTHEPIIDMETWEIVQRVRAGRHRPNKMGEMDMLSGIVCCADCGKRHYFCRCGSWNESQYTYTCGTYHEHKEDCTPHTIKVMALHQIALAEIRRVTQDAKQHTDTFLARAMDKHQSGLKKELSVKMRECEKGTKRLADLDKLFRKAFEEMTLEHLSNQQFQMLTQGYEAEKQELSERIALLEMEIATSQDKMLNSDRFLKLVDKYTDIQELTPALVREFIDKIVVHERSEPRKKKNYTQQVDVYFNFVGKV